MTYCSCMAAENNSYCKHLAQALLFCTQGADRFGLPLTGTPADVHAYAVSLDARAVYYGAHSGDHAIYPDCRPEFVEKMNDVSQIANYDPVDIVSPYIKVDKIGILTDGIRMGLDYGQTWTCYNGRKHACGQCGSCQERLEAFEKNGIQDPLSYE